MLVSVTGGTGFVGAHTVSALVRAGHQVRLLVRDESRVDSALTPLDVDPRSVDLVGGDVLDEMSVARAVKGADAVLHAASVYSFDSRLRATMRQTNEQGTEIVLGAGRRLDVPVVHVSSVGALFPARGKVIGTDSPVGTAKETYLASKAAAERIARRYQEDGAPVAITYPPALLGPHDPHLGDQTSRLRNVLRGLTPIWPGGGLPIGDVRDTAALHAMLLTGQGSESGRYFGPGHYLTTRQYVKVIRGITGRALPTVFLPARAMLPVGRLADLLQRVWPWHIPAEYGAIYTCACATRVEENADTLGIAPRPVTQTILDTIGWMYGKGHLSARQAGAVGRNLMPVAAR